GGCRRRALAVLRALYAGTASRVRVGGVEASPFAVSTGVRQGAVLSPLLFGLAVDWVMREVLAELPAGAVVGVPVSAGSVLFDLDYADDIALVAVACASAQLAVDGVGRVAARVGLVLNPDKCAVLASCCERPPRVLVAGRELAVVSELRYLGSVLAATGDLGGEVSTRIRAAAAAFAGLRLRLWRRRDVSVRTKVRVYMSLVRSVLLYACETWAPGAEDLRRLEVFDRRCL